MEKPFVISALAFLVEMASLTLSLSVVWLRPTSESACQRPLLVTTVTAAVVALLFPLAFLWRAPAAIQTMHPVVAIALVVAVLLPVVQVLILRRAKLQRLG